MSENTANRGGRPEIGPPISVAYQPELLDDIDRAAARAQTSRAAWLRGAAHAMLPTGALHPLAKRSVLAPLTELDDQISGLRSEALDRDEPFEDRAYCGIAYEAAANQAFEIFHQARLALDGPHAEAERAFTEAQRAGDENSPELAEAFGRLTAIETAQRLLRELAASMPNDGHAVKSSSRLPDPTEDV